MEKIKYEKPVSLNAGEVASVLGLNCSTGNDAIDICQYGNSADSGCATGDDPAVIEYCPTGSVATSNCYPTGGQAGHSCNTGSNPGW